MPKDTHERKLNLTFKGKDRMSQEMEDAIWAEFFEILGLFTKGDDLTKQQDMTEENLLDDDKDRGIMKMLIYSQNCPKVFL